MSLVPSFTVSESLANPNEITFTDNSGGSDGTITNRKISVKLANGNWLDETGGQSTTRVYIDWAYSDVSITLSLLSNSTSPNMTVGWYAGSTLAYPEVTESACFNLYDYLFGLQVLQGNTSAPDQIQDTNYYSSMMKFIVNLFNEENPITYGSDIYSSQGAINLNLWMIQHQNDYF